jgi:putative colanic acid biosysnthesis UDP-glucose lipid carrier transferase
MAQKYITIFKWIHVIVDYFLLNLSLVIAVAIKSEVSLQNLPDTYKVYFLLLNLIWFYCANVSELYNNILKRDSFRTIQLTILSLGMFMLAPLILKVVLVSLGFKYHTFLIATVIFSVSILAWKIAFLFVRRSRRRFWINYTKIIIVGAGPLGLDLLNYFNTNHQLRYQVVGFFGDNLSRRRKNKMILGKVKDCIAYAEASGITEIFCTLPSNEARTINLLMQEADKHMVRFRLVPDVKGLFNKHLSVQFYDYFPVLTPRQEPLENKANEIIKRTFDFAFASLVIVFLLSWVIPIIAIIIKLESKGPVFFKQLRSGRDNKPFYCLKFRSMTVNSDADSRQASLGDSRITKVGAFLRKSSLDELPQFFNVLRGEMSVVGPRPHMLKHTHDYSLLINKYMVRQFLTPGITGWAQINGFRGETIETSAMSKRVEADLWYLENWSFLLDLKIVFLTVWQSIKGNKNAF